MMKLLLALTLTLAVFLPRAQAVADTLPFLTTFRSQVANQLTIASNNIVATNDVRGNTRLKKTLIGALRTIDRTKTNSYVAGASALNVLNRTFYRTSLSNTFNPLVDQTRDVYVASLYLAYSNYAARVNASYPGRSQTAAFATLARLLAAIDTANTNTNVLVALRFLSTAARTETATLAATKRAEAAPLPPQQYTATIAGALYGTFNFTPKPANAIAAVRNIALNNLQMNGVSGTVSGSGFSTKSTVRTLFINIPNLANGTTVYDVGSGSGKAFVNYTVARGGIGGADPADGYEAVSGTLTVTVNLAAKTAVGTFSFSAPGENNPGSTASTSNGKFSVLWIE